MNLLPRLRLTPRQIASKIASAEADKTATLHSHPADAGAYAADTFERVYAAECRKRGLDPDSEDET